MVDVWPRYGVRWPRRQASSLCSRRMARGTDTCDAVDVMRSGRGVHDGNREDEKTGVSATDE